MFKAVLLGQWHNLSDPKLDGIMHKKGRGKELTEYQKQFNKLVSQDRWVLEQTFGTLKRKFRFTRTSYFGLVKFKGQALLKAMCINLLKAINKVSILAPKVYQIS